MPRHLMAPSVSKALLNRARLDPGQIIGAAGAGRRIGGRAVVPDIGVREGIIRQHRATVPAPHLRVAIGKTEGAGPFAVVPAPRNFSPGVIPRAWGVDSKTAIAHVVLGLVLAGGG